MKRGRITKRAIKSFLVGLAVSITLAAPGVGNAVCQEVVVDPGHGSHRDYGRCSLGRCSASPNACSSDAHCAGASNVCRLARCGFGVACASGTCNIGPPDISFCTLDVDLHCNTNADCFTGINNDIPVGPCIPMGYQRPEITFGTTSIREDNLTVRLEEETHLDPFAEINATRSEEHIPNFCNTRKTGCLRQRIEFANRRNASAFVSIHTNAFSSPFVSGTEAFYCSSNDSALADSIHSELVATGLRLRGTHSRCGLTVLRLALVPAVLTEVAFHTNIPVGPFQTDTDAQRLASAGGRIVMGNAIETGIINWCQTQ